MRGDNAKIVVFLGKRERAFAVREICNIVHFEEFRSKSKEPC